MHSTLRTCHLGQRAFLSRVPFRYKSNMPLQTAVRSSSAEHDQPGYRNQAQLLERIFYSDTAPVQPEASFGSQESAGLGGSISSLLCPADLPGVITDMPVWRAQGTTLPGYQEVYHVIEPHLCDMLSRLLSSPRPWRFGHLYMPNGSPNQGKPEYELAPGTQAPLVGTLMEVLQAVHFPDGRLLVLAVGLSRVKVVSSRQSVPHPRADLVLLPDWEEVQQQQHLALQAMHCEAKGGSLQVAAAMQASAVAAEHAAAAASQAWWDYEVSSAAFEALIPHTQQQGVIAAGSEAEAQAHARRLVAAASHPVAALPTHTLAAAERGDWLFPSSYPTESGEEGEGFAAAAAALCLRCAVCAAAADAAALVAAVTGIRAFHARAASPHEGAAAAPPRPSLSHSSSGVLQGINSATDRGVPSHIMAALHVYAVGSTPATSGGVAEAAVQDGVGGGVSRSLALRLEQMVWHELDAVCQLAGRMQRRRVPLGVGLEQLRPPGAAPAPTPHPEASGVVPPAAGSLLHPSYPPLRRAQRLSYALASALGDVSGEEGRQALLEVSSISDRLRLGLAGLRRHRGALAALVSVQELG